MLQVSDGWLTLLILNPEFTVIVGLKKDADSLLMHPIAEIEQLELENHSLIDSGNIRLVPSSISTIHLPSINVDMNVSQLPNTDDITSITKTQLTNSQQ